MATYEQCEEVMRNRFKTKDDILAFCKRYQSSKHVSIGPGASDEEFIDRNIKSIVDYAEKLGRLDHLGRSLGILTNAEQERRSRTNQGIFQEGEEFDATAKIITLFKSAEMSIVLIDGYIDEKLLNMLTVKEAEVKVSILTHKMNPATTAAAETFNKQYRGLSVRKAKGFHDRYLLIDDNDLYHSGHSFKDLGKAVSTIGRITAQDEIDKVRNSFRCLWEKAKVVV